MTEPEPPPPAPERFPASPPERFLAQFSALAWFWLRHRAHHGFARVVAPEGLAGYWCPVHETGIATPGDEMAARVLGTAAGGAGPGEGPARF